MLKFIQNQRGVTLVELLTSITILFIILLTFMAFFTNAFQFNHYSSDKIDATNLAREVQESFKAEDDKKLALSNLVNDTKSLVGPVSISKEIYPDLNLNKDIILDSSKTLELSMDTQGYIVLVYINQPNTNTQQLLYQIQVKVIDKNKVLSETFTYIEL